MALGPSWADADQSSADADQTSSDADQTASDSDAFGAFRDQVASDRDQAAADRVHHADTHPTAESEDAYGAAIGRRLGDDRDGWLRRRNATRLRRV